MIKQPLLIPMSSSHHFHRSQDLRVLVKSLFSAIWLWFIENLIDISKLPYIYIYIPYIYIYIPYIYTHTYSIYIYIPYVTGALWFSDVNISGFPMTLTTSAGCGSLEAIIQISHRPRWSMAGCLSRTSSAGILFHRIHGKIIDDIPSLCIMIYIYIIIFYKWYIIYYILYIIYYILYIYYIYIIYHIIYYISYIIYILYTIYCIIIILYYFIFYIVYYLLYIYILYIYIYIILSIYDFPVVQITWGSKETNEAINSSPNHSDALARDQWAMGQNVWTWSNQLWLRVPFGSQGFDS